MQNVYSMDTIEDLVAYLLNKPDTDKFRQTLLTEFDRLFTYSNSAEWNQLVRICEALRIIGWGEREPVEAICEKWINGSYYSQLRTKTFAAIPASERRWARQGDTFVLDEGSDRHDYGIEALASQRNPLPKNPVRFIRSGNYQLSVQPLVDCLQVLRTRLDQHMRQEEYGDDFGYLGIHCNFSHHDDPSPSMRYEYFHAEEDVPEGLTTGYYIRPRLHFGRLDRKKGQLKLEVTRHYTRAEGELPLNEQKELFAQDLLEIVGVLAQKLKKKKVQYRIELLEADLLDLLTQWQRED